MRKVLKPAIMIFSLVLATSLTVDAKKKKKKKMAKGAAPMANTWDRNYGLAGCGLGSVVMGKEGNQVIAATTNNIYGIESTIFGITFGTSNCVEDGADKMALNIDRFVESNNVSLASDMARGSGETVTALGQMLGCDDAAQFGSVMKSNFHKIYPNEKVKAMEVTDSVINIMLQDENLSQSCDNFELS